MGRPWPGPLRTAGLAPGTPRLPPAAPGQLGRARARCPQSEPRPPPRRLLPALLSERHQLPSRISQQRPPCPAPTVSLRRPACAHRHPLPLRCTRLVCVFPKHRCALGTRGRQWAWQGTRQAWRLDEQGRHCHGMGQRPAQHGLRGAETKPCARPVPGARPPPSAAGLQQGRVHASPAPRVACPTAACQAGPGPHRSKRSARRPSRSRRTALAGCRVCSARDSFLPGLGDR